jgi:hypothetical protein
MRRRSGARIAGFGALALLIFATPAGATITAVPHTSDGAQLALTHMVGTGNQTFASAAFYTGPDKVLMVPTAGNPVAYADGASGRHRSRATGPSS